MVDATDQLIGARIRVARLACGLTQRAFGSSLGVSKQQVWKYENGESQLTVSRLVQIAQVLRMAPSTLLDQLTTSQASENDGEQSQLISVFWQLDRRDQSLLLSIAHSVAAAARKKTLNVKTLALPRDEACAPVVIATRDGRRSLELAGRH